MPTSDLAGKTAEEVFDAFDGPMSQRTVGRLLQTATGADRGPALLAIRLLGMAAEVDLAPRDRVLPVLRGLLEHGGQDRVYHVIKALWQARDPDAVPALRALLDASPPDAAVPLAHRALEVLKSVEPKTSFGERLRELRLERGVSLADIADHLGVSTSYLSTVERGKAHPLVSERLREVAALLRVDPDELFLLASRERGAFVMPCAQLPPLGRRLMIAMLRVRPHWTDAEFREFVAGVLE